MVVQLADGTVSTDCAFSSNHGGQWCVGRSSKTLARLDSKVFDALPHLFFLFAIESQESFSQYVLSILLGGDAVGMIVSVSSGIRIEMIS
jgi:hypothetical protein